MHFTLLSKPRLCQSLIMAALSCVLGLDMASASAATPQQSRSSSVVGNEQDSRITHRVMARLIRQPSLKQSDIRVMTTNGVVTLTGTVNSEHAKRVAVNTAKVLRGVHQVHSTLTLASAVRPVSPTPVLKKTGQVISDSWITSKVKSILVIDPRSKNFDLGVTTQGGVVILTGMLDSQVSVRYVVLRTLDVKGVKSVDISALTTASQ